MSGRAPVKKGMFGELIVFVLFLFSARLCWSICCTLSQMFTVRSVLGDKKSSDVEQS